MIRFYITIVLLVVALITNLLFTRTESSLTRHPLNNFPKTLGDWKAIDDQNIAASSIAVLRVDDYIMRRYINKEENILGLYIGYFENQREGKQVQGGR